MRSSTACTLLFTRLELPRLGTCSDCSNWTGQMDCLKCPEAASILQVHLGHGAEKGIMQGRWLH